MSAAPIRLLHLEDDALDAALVRETLRADGLVCEIDVVASREAFEAALARGGYAVVLADYSLPGFDGLTAQRIADTRAPDVPFIFVSGTLGEEIAVERIKAGATDYVLKQRIARLGSAVRRAIAEAAERRQRLDAQAALRRLNAELEARVERRTEQLEAANARLAARERALADSEARLAAILDNSPTAIYVKDLDGRYILFNRQLEAALPAPLALGDRADGILPPHVVSVLRRNDREVVARDTAMQFEEIVPGPDGPRVYMSSKFPLRGADGAVYAVCGISTDITHRKEHEEELKLARLEAERANQAKSEFLSRMSHDLRTPLNAVLGFAQLLDLDALRPDQSDSVRQILKGGRHLLELINEILEIARIESGHLALSLEPVNVGESIDQSLALVAPLAAARAIHIHADPIAPDRFVAADRHRIAQVLLNLLSNAVKYNHPGGRVAIHVDEGRDARTRIAIADTGPGIPLTKRHLLFQPFERLGAEHTAVEGTGLGLTVARRLTERMGGELDFRSDDGGSTFWIELPSCAAPQEVTAPAPADPLPAPVPASSGLVLYVEDNLSNVRLLERVLARRPGVQLAHTAIGCEAVDLAVRLKPSLVLLDMHLSDTTGDAVFDELRRRPETRHIPVVVLSADAMPDHVARLNAAGIVAYLTKPINVAEVLRLVDRTLV